MKEVLNGRYVREYLQTFFTLPYVGGPDDEYKIKMLENNETVRILAPAVMNEGGEERCKYRIGGNKAMELVFRTLTIDLARLIAVLNSFVAVFEEVAELLLDPDDLVLLPEYVFINISDYNANFVYLPGYGRKIKEQAETFFEFMLNRVDYDDRRAVTLLYDCYILSMKEEKGIEALKERIDKEAPAPLGAIYKENIDKDAAAERVTQSTEDTGTLKGWFARCFKKKKEQFYSGGTDGEERLFEEESQDTVLLSVRRQECNPGLLNLKNNERIVIDKLPFIIGSLSDHTDYAPGGNVSRLHAEIKRNGNGISIADLNSTNGTKVNDISLVPGEECMLFNNDRISLADIDFIYKEGTN